MSQHFVKSTQGFIRLNPVDGSGPLRQDGWSLVPYLHVHCHRLRALSGEHVHPPSWTVFRSGEGCEVLWWLHLQSGNAPLTESLLTRNAKQLFLSDQHWCDCFQLCWGAPLTWADILVKNLIPVTIGNAIAGAFVLWWTLVFYKNPPKQHPTRFAAHVLDLLRLWVLACRSLLADWERRKRRRSRRTRMTSEVRTLKGWQDQLRDSQWQRHWGDIGLPGPIFRRHNKRLP